MGLPGCCAGGGKKRWGMMIDCLTVMGLAQG